MSARLRLLEGCGIELEYMIVDARTLNVRPLADALLQAEAGEPTCWVERGSVEWSNELVAHVIEMKTGAPVSDLVGVGAVFQQNVARMNTLLAPLGARLLPGGMHPWMDPKRETTLWAHEGAHIYETFHRLFDCHRHGWANLQSMHINLSFDSDAEFGALHAATRVVVPFIPALAASTPFQERRLTGLCDTRLAVYRRNSENVPSFAGQVVPEAVFTAAEYERAILAPIAADVARIDPTGTLKPQWCNARGCIARFDRGSIEIRVTDMQECPGADLAVAVLVRRLVAALCAGRWVDPERLRDVPSASLVAVLDRGITDGSHARVEDDAVTELFGLPAGTYEAREVWQHVFESVLTESEAAEALPFLRHVVSEGTLSERLRAATEHGESIESLHGRLGECLAKGERFSA